MNQKNKFKLAFIISSILIFFGVIGVVYQLWDDFQTPKPPVMKQDQDAFVISFDASIKREEQKKVLAEFPQVKYLREGASSQEVVVKIKEESNDLFERLMGRREVDYVIPLLFQGFDSIQSIDEKRYVVSFAPTIKRDEQKKILNDFPTVEYLRDGIFPQVALVRIEENAPALVKQLEIRLGIDWVVPDQPGMVCH